MKNTDRAQDLEPLDITLEEGRRALGVHALEKGHWLREKYGAFIDDEVLRKILKDKEFVRYPVRVEFDSAKVEKGLFAAARKISADSSDGYIIFVHEHFRKRPGDLPALVFYHLAAVNYGDLATFNEAEEFASAALGMDKDYYYEYICRLADSIPA